MNQIVKNAIHKLNQLKETNIGSYYSEQITYLIYALQNGKDLVILNFIGYYYILDDLFQLCHFSPLESGYLFSKIIDYNSYILQSKTTRFIRPEIYVKDFRKRGILDSEIYSIYESYAQNQSISFEQVSYISVAKHILDSILLCSPDSPSVQAKHFYHYCKKENFLILDPDFIHAFSINSSKEYSFYRLISKFYADPFQKPSFIHSLQNYLMQILNLSKQTAHDLVHSYFIDSSMQTYWTHFKKELIQFVESTFQKDFQYYQRISSYYDQIQQFLDCPCKTEQAYLSFSKLLKQEIPERLVSSYLNYLKSSRYPVLKSQEKTRKELKNELDDLLKGDTFDYSCYFDLLNLLQKLNYADSVNEDIFNQIYQKAVYNSSFYTYLYYKARAIDPNLHILSEIAEVIEEKKVASKEEKDVWDSYLNSLFPELFSYGATHMEYDLSLVYKPKNL